MPVFVLIDKGAQMKKSTICWDCKKAIKGCSWSKSFVPVRGWDATKTMLFASSGRREKKKFRHVESYIVSSCPEFVRDSMGFGYKRIRED